MNGTDTIELRTEERTRCEVWTRVMGYHRPVSAFNAGKRSEHRERRHFVEQSPKGHAAGSGPDRCASARRTAAA
jgi:hypothetical protein